MGTKNVAHKIEQYQKERRIVAVNGEWNVAVREVLQDFESLLTALAGRHGY